MKGSIRKRGQSWEYSFDVGKDENGKRRRKSKSGFQTKAAAEEAMRIEIVRFENTGRVLNDKGKMSVAEYMYFYYEKHVLLSCKYRTQVEYKRIIDNDINPHIGHYYLKNLTPHTIQDFLDKHFERGISKKTMEMIFSVLKFALDTAVFPYEFIKENPSRYIKLKYKFKQADINRISQEDAKDVLSYLKTNYYNYFIPYQIMYHTGLRKSETLGLTWDNIDLDNNIIKVRQQAIYKDGKMELMDTKTPSSVGDVLFGDTLRDELLDYRDMLLQKRVNHNFVCVNTNLEQMTTNNFNWIVRKIKEDLNIRANAHSFRHLHGQIILDHKGSTVAIKSRLRHANIKTTLQTYLTSSDKINKMTVDLLEDVL